MLPYLKCLLCMAIITIAHCLGIDRKYSDLKIIEKNSNYQMTKGNGDKVELKVYYGALSASCQDCNANELHEVLQKLGSYIDIIDYPFGWGFIARHINTTIIICEYGQEGCYGNQLHACAVDILKNATQSHAYNTCMMQSQWGGHGSTDMDAIKCGELMKIDSKAVIDCAKSKRGRRLLEYYADETVKAHIRYIPWILINGKQMDIFSDLLPQVCNALATPPPVCLQYAGAAHLTKG